MRFFIRPRKQPEPLWRWAENWLHLLNWRQPVPKSLWSLISEAVANAPPEIEQVNLERRPDGSVTVYCQIGRMCEVYHFGVLYFPEDRGNKKNLREDIS